jgi:3-oxoacyl-[acyl-carrier protein] reductase
MGLLEGKVAIVTGGSRGIGKAIALYFAKEGAQVAFTDLNEDENFKSVEKELNDLGVKAKGYVSNAANFDDCQNTVNEIVKEFGRVDALINNAGITKDNLLMRMTEEQWDMVMNVNLKSIFNMTKAVQRTMLKQKSGSIVNMSSVVGVGGNAGQSNYSASKAGMIGFTKSIAKELGSRNVRCNAIAPGFIITEMTGQLPEEVVEGWFEKIPLKRGGTAEEVAKTALFFASDLSSYVSGQTLTVCGAMQT